MHESVMQWTGAVLAGSSDVARQLQGQDGLRVLDVGSLDVNGSTRSLFSIEHDQYTGVDLRDGPGVDVVLAAADLGDWFVHGWFDVVLCTEMLEHDPTPWATFSQVALVLRRGGLALFTARGVSSARCELVDRPHAFGQHGEPDDWWRFMPGTLSMLATAAGLVVLDEVEDWQAPGWFCAAVRP